MDPMGYSWAVFYALWSCQIEAPSLLVNFRTAGATWRRRPATGWERERNEGIFRDVT